MRQLFTESIRQSRKPAKLHPHREILPLRVAGRNVIVVRVPANDTFTRAHANGGTVSCFRRFANAAINLFQHRVINLSAERIFNRCQILYKHIGMQSALEDGEWDRYCRIVDRRCPKFNDTIPLPLND